MNRKASHPALRAMSALGLLCGCGARSELDGAFDGYEPPSTGGSDAGGAPGAGGGTGTGGAQSSGGVLAVGGSALTGGTTSTGGAIATGGSGGTIASLIVADREPMGPTCAYGGTRVRTGLDDGLPGGIARNGILETEEVDPLDTSYACSDCLHLAVVGGDNSPLAAVAYGVQGAAADVICEVGLFNVDTVELTPAALAPYATMLVFNTNGFPFDGAALVGTAVSDYFDDGGQVVVTLFADGGYAITGDWTAKRYNRLTHEWAPFLPDSFSRSNPAQGVLPDHPLLLGVELLSGQGWIAPIVPTEDSVLVAAYASGTVLAAAGPVKDAQGRLRHRVDLNIHPEDIVSGTWAGDGFRLLANAIMYY